MSEHSQHCTESSVDAFPRVFPQPPEITVMRRIEKRLFVPIFIVADSAFFFSKKHAMVVMSLPQKTDVYTNPKLKSRS